MLKILLLFNFLAFSISEKVFDEIQAEPRTSKIEGIVLKTTKGEEYFSFRGIPYAKPPVDELRFKDPQPLEEHPDFIDAKFDGHDCPSIYATNASEDCLTINVYTKSVNTSAQLPVLVMIHPGGLYIGSGLSSNLNAEYLMSKNIVVVTFNYRLGSLGFLSLGTKTIPGNAGFKDQVLALRWVQNYIKYFGGNSKNVVLMGYSAGALSVGLHLVSPMSRGLFHKAVMMSGALPPTVSLEHDQLELAQKQARVLGCKEAFMPRTQNATNLLECFNKFSGNEIAATLRKMFVFGKDNPIFLWLPVIEHDFGQERFLTEPVNESLKKGDYMNVPLIYGFTEGELCESAIDIVKNTTLRNELIHNLDILAPKIFMYDGLPNEQQLDKTKNIKKIIITNGHINCARLCDAFSDSIIRSGMLEFSKNFAKKHAYNFTYINPERTTDQCGAKARAQHMDDLEYIFKMPTGPQKITKADQTVTNHVIEFIFAFMVDALAEGHKELTYDVDTGSLIAKTKSD